MIILINTEKQFDKIQCPVTITLFFFFTITLFDEIKHERIFAGQQDKDHVRVNPWVTIQ